MSAVKITASNFAAEVKGSEKPVLLDFWASWCGPCRMVSPVVDEIAAERPDILVGKVNVDEEPELASAFNISSIPTLVVMRGGEIVNRATGARPKSSILSLEEFRNFSHIVRDINCGLCQNNCRLTVNTFSGGRKLISGNRCERPITHRIDDGSLNLYDYKLRLLQSYQSHSGPRGRIGIPLGLNFYELLPFWHTFFSSLGFSVVTSPLSNRGIYLRGQNTIPSDTVCFPAKLMHGHIQTLIDQGVKYIFYPCMSYNLDEGISDNHYNCPVVAYYPEVIGANMPDLEKVIFIKDYVGIHNPRYFAKKAFEMLSRYIPNLARSEAERAAKDAYAELDAYHTRVRMRGEEIIARAREEGRQIIVLAGRPYHVDPEINHGIDKLIAGFGAAIVSEDVVSERVKEPVKVHVLNQWTYHARLYAAARYIKDQPDMHLVQLVSFGCGIDAITTDEVRSLLEEEGRLYTQIKIDEITNLGAVKIRLRSLFAAVEQQQRQKEGASL